MECASLNLHFALSTRSQTSQKFGHRTNFTLDSTWYVAAVHRHTLTSVVFVVVSEDTLTSVVFVVVPEDTLTSVVFVVVSEDTLTSVVFVVMSEDLSAANSLDTMPHIHHHLCC